VPLGADGAHGDVAKPLSSDVVGGDASTSVSPGGPCLDLVVCSPGPSLPGSIAPSDAVPAPGSLGAVDTGVIILGLLGYHGALSPPVSWRQVENSAKQACSWIAATDRLL
jgi:hypothetical protein